MRCTKCHYLSFEPESRCRNCGHDLSMDEAAEFDLAETTLRGLADTTAGTNTAAGRKAAAAPVSAEFPLFAQDRSAGQDDDDLEPLVKVPARPRAPIAVRRATPDSARLRAAYGSPAVRERDLLDEMHALDDLPGPALSAPLWSNEPTPEQLPAAWLQVVSGGTRLAAAAIDAALLGGIAAVVTYSTLRLVGLPINDVGLLPVAPLAALFLLIAVGYLLLFTAAGGQTIGKMVMNIRVVGTSPEAVINDRVTVAQAAVRSLAALPSVLVLGVGFAPALVGAGLAVHDRVSHTRVVHS